METLTRAGAFDSLHQLDNNFFVLWILLLDIRLAVLMKTSNQTNLFGEQVVEISSPLVSSIDEWEDAQRLKEEHSAYDFYFSIHLDQYFVPLSKIGVLTSSEVFEKGY